MSELTPQIDAILDNLTSSCVESLAGEESLAQDNVFRLVEALYANGFERHADRPLVEYLRTRVLDKVPEKALARKAEVTRVCQQVQEWYNQKQFSSSVDTQHAQLSDPESFPEDREQGNTQSPPDVYRT